MSSLPSTNLQVAAGSVGQQPSQAASYQVTVSTLSRLYSEEQFSDIVIRTGEDGQVVRLRDVARIGFGAELEIEDHSGAGRDHGEGFASAGTRWHDGELPGKLPQVQIDLDFETLQVNLGSLYANEFNRFCRTYRVIVQADAPFRAQVDDIARMKVRNAAGEMVPLAALATVATS